ncbi:MAG TPA: hypothetical protein ENK61_06275 [Devosia sp.]|nr:hypothetical protein [Devosia sp.]
MNSSLFKSILVASTLLMIATSSNTVMAQQSSPTFKFSLFKIDNFLISKTISLDADFAAANPGLEIPAPFRIAIPEQNGITPLYNVGDGSNGEILKISFTTGNRETPISERKLVENIRFIAMTLPLVDQTQRLDNLADLVRTQIFPMATNGYQDIQYVGAKASTFGDLVVLEAVGQYIDPSIGLMLVHIVGYPNPNDINSVFAVSNIVADMFDFSSFDDLGFTGGGRTLSSFEYLNK